MEDGEGLRVENNPGKAIVVEPWGRDRWEASGFGGSFE